MSSSCNLHELQNLCTGMLVYGIRILVYMNVCDNICNICVKMIITYAYNQVQVVKAIAKSGQAGEGVEEEEEDHDEDEFQDEIEL